jgi:hypothetical protein
MMSRFWQWLCSHPVLIVDEIGDIRCKRCGKDLTE